MSYCRIRSWWVSLGLFVVGVSATGCVEDSDCYLTRTCPGPSASMDAGRASGESDGSAPHASETEDPEQKATDTDDSDADASNTEDDSNDDEGDDDTDDTGPGLDLPLVPLPPATASGSIEDASAAPGEVDAGAKDSGATSPEPEPLDYCAENNGGCDLLAICISGPAGAECGECPAGYLGSGTTGCAPGLLGLELSHGAASPAIDPSTASYEITVPVFVQDLSLSPAVPSSASVSIHGSLVAPGTKWTSPPLDLGLNTITLQVEQTGQPSSTYTLNVTRGAAATVYVKASNTGALDSFGTAVALSGDGSTLAIGAIQEGSNARGVGTTQENDDAPNSGAVYVFARNDSGWAQQAYIKASNTGVGDRFGGAVALSNDGNTLAVGAHREYSSATGVGSNQNSDDAADSGAVYVFTRSGNGWAQQAYIKASNTGAGDFFGGAVALSSDGNTLAVGADAEDSSGAGVGGVQSNDDAADSGAVYLFTRSGSGWAQQAYVKASNAGVGDRFGGVVALSSDGNTLAVGAHLEDSSATGIGGVQDNDDASRSGAVYVFTRSGGDWVQRAYIKASNTGVGDYFGQAVALSSNGDTLAVGAYLEDGSATGVGGSQSNDDANGSGAVYVFTRSGSGWAQQAYIKASNTGTNDYFGGAVALSSDGNTLAVGAYGDDSNATGVGSTQHDDDATSSGAVYVFTRSGSDWAQQAYVKGSNTGAGDSFGWAIALSGDGNTLAVGAHLEGSSATGVGGSQNNDDASGSGAVYIYR